MEKKAALYARVSTTRQEQAATIESRVAELESYAQEQGYEINPDLIFLDQAISESRLARPAYPKPAPRGQQISMYRLQSTILLG